MSTPLLPILVPGFLGLAILLLPARLSGARTALGLLGALGAFAFATTVVPGVARIDLGATRLGPLDLGLSFRAGPFPAWLVLFTAGITLLVASYSVGYFGRRGGPPGRYYGYLLLASSGAAGVLLSDNLLLLVLFWEVVTLSLFLLVATGRPDGAPSAAKAFTMLGAGDMALLVGVILLGVIRARAGAVAPLDIPSIVASPVGTASGLGMLAGGLLLAAAATKAGAMPFSSWLPAMSTSTEAPVMALLPSALDKVLGIYLLIRVCVDLTAPGPGLRLAILLVGAVTILAAVFLAMVQRDLRRLLSYQAVSQVGYMFLGIGTGTVVGVVGGAFHMLNHAIYKSCLFLGAGEIERETGTTDLDRLGGLGKTMPVTLLALFVASLSMAGIPPLNAFASKWFVFHACLLANQPLFLVVALFGSVLTLASSVKVLQSVFFGPRPPALDGAAEKGSTVLVPLAVLAGLCVLLGVFAALPLDYVAGPAAGLVPGTETGGATLLESAAGVYRPTVLTGLLLLGAVAAFGLLRCASPGPRRVRPVFFGGMPVDRETNRFPGTEFYRTVSDVPGLGPALASGDRGTFDPYRIARKVGGPPIAWLCRLHTGLVGDYLAFSLVGLVLVLLYLVLG